MLGHTRDVQPEWVSFRGQKYVDGCKFWSNTCGWVIILIHKTSGLVTSSTILPGSGWFSCKLSKTYLHLAYFDSCFILHSLGMVCSCLSMGQL